MKQKSEQPVQTDDRMAKLDAGVERQKRLKAEMDKPVQAAYEALKKDFDPHVPTIATHIREVREFAATAQEIIDKAIAAGYAGDQLISHAIRELQGKMSNLAFLSEGLRAYRMFSPNVLRKANGFLDRNKPAEYFEQFRSYFNPGIGNPRPEMERLVNVILERSARLSEDQRWREQNDPKPQLQAPITIERPMPRAREVIVDDKFIP